MGDKNSFDDGMVEWVTDSTVNADGFWNPTTVGSSIRGILLLQRLVDGKGKNMDNPFYIFELTEDATSDVFVDQKPVKVLPKGKYIGLNCWKRLQGITRRMGHEFHLIYLGKTQLKSSRKLVNLRIRCSPKQVREVERMSPGLLEAGDEE